MDFCTLCCILIFCLALTCSLQSYKLYTLKTKTAQPVERYAGMMPAYALPTLNVNLASSR